MELLAIPFIPTMQNIYLQGKVILFDQIDF